MQNWQPTIKNELPVNSYCCFKLPSMVKMSWLTDMLTDSSLVSVSVVSCGWVICCCRTVGTQKCFELINKVSSYHQCLLWGVLYSNVWDSHSTLPKREKLAETKNITQKLKRQKKKTHKKTTPVHTINVYSGVFFKLMFETVIQHYPKERNSQRPRTLKYWNIF